VSQTKEDMQLQVWKDLALQKQLLANEVIKALDLDTTSSAAVIKDELNKLLDRAKHADDNIKASRQRADEAITELRTEFKAEQKARTKAESAIDDAVAAQKSAENALAVGREANADGLKKAKEDVARKDRELKNINTALGDSPDNVVKKLKNLKKQKLDENTARKAAETSVRKLKKEKKDLEDKLDERKTLLEQSATLIEQYRELRTVAEEHLEKINESVSEDDDKAKLPEQDDKLLESIEMAATVEKDD